MELKKIRSCKIKLQRKIMKKVLPLMWKSGYVGELKIFCFPDKKKSDDRRVFKIGSILVEGFTENGDVILDSYGGGMVTQSISSLYLEDVIKLNNFVQKDKYKLLTNEK